MPASKFGCVRNIGFGLLGLGGLVVLAAVSPAPALAQDAQEAAMIQLGAQLWKETFPCRDCHGGMADGVGDIPQLLGPNLHKAQLTREQVAETIRCGRPGTEMPYFERGAYSDGRCYGMTEAALGAMMPSSGSPQVSQRSLNGLVAFLMANFIGKPDPTYADCTAIWGEGSQRCDRFPR